MTLHAPSRHAVRDADPAAPRHVAIIMDGNGRWANERGMPRLSGRKAGAEKSAASSAPSTSAAWTS